MNKSLWLTCLVLIFFTSHIKAQDWVYVVADGDNIWNISKRYLKDIKYFEDVAKINNVKTPKRMQPGTVLRIPFKWVASHASAVTVKHLKGEAQRVRGKTKTAVNTDTEFELGDELRLAPKAIITLVFADKSEILISKASIVKFDHLTQYGETGMVDTRIRLIQGKIEIRANKQVGPGARLDIKTASAVTSVRGTIFRVGALLGSVLGEETSTVEVVEGEVSVAAGAENVAITEGFGLKVENGKPLGEPVALLAAPKFVRQRLLVTKPKEIIQWQAVTDAHAYVVVIASDPQLTKIISREQTQKSQTQLEFEQDGKYFISVSAIDSNGMEGLPNTRELETNIYPRPPQQLEKPVVFRDGKDEINWDSESRFAFYQLQVAKDKAFSDIVLSQKLDALSFNPSLSLDSGEYYWRIAAYGDDDDLGPYSIAKAFTLSTPFTPLTLNALLIQKNVRISWQGLAKGQYVELEVADNPQFENATLIQQKKQSFLEQPIPESRNLFVRARPVLSLSNEKGEWSKSCKISSSSALALCKI